MVGVPDPLDPFGEGGMILLLVSGRGYLKFIVIVFFKLSFRKYTPKKHTQHEKKQDLRIWSHLHHLPSAPRG